MVPRELIGFAFPSAAEARLHHTGVGGYAAAPMLVFSSLTVAELHSRYGAARPRSNGRFPSYPTLTSCTKCAKVYASLLLIFLSASTQMSLLVSRV